MDDFNLGSKAVVILVLLILFLIVIFVVVRNILGGLFG